MRVQLVGFNGRARLYADMAEPDARAVLISGAFEPEFFDICLAFLPPGGCFFDVGANVGFCSFGVASERSDVRVHAFEPNPHLHALMLASSTLYLPGAVTPIRVCVLDTGGTSRLAVPEGKTVLAFIDPHGGIEAPNLRLDDYIESHGIDRIDCMKIDVEGSELRVLEGARGALRAGKVKTIYTEVMTPHLRRAGATPCQVFDFLADHCFDVYWCKAFNFARGDASPLDMVRLEVRGKTIKAARVRRTTLGQTVHADWLAVHRSANVGVA